MDLSGLYFWVHYILLGAHGKLRLPDNAGFLSFRVTPEPGYIEMAVLVVLPVIASLLV